VVFVDMRVDRHVDTRIATLRPPTEAK